ncbi:hypothetical protein PG984_005320 [Apiospora sp. TS-2023a]
MKDIDTTVCTLVCINRDMRFVLIQGENQRIRHPEVNTVVSILSLNSRSFVGQQELRRTSSNHKSLPEPSTTCPTSSCIVDQSLVKISLPPLRHFLALLSRHDNTPILILRRGGGAVVNETLHLLGEVLGQLRASLVGLAHHGQPSRIVPGLIDSAGRVASRQPSPAETVGSIVRALHRVGVPAAVDNPLRQFRQFVLDIHFRDIALDGRGHHIVEAVEEHVGHFFLPGVVGWRLRVVSVSRPLPLDFGSVGKLEHGGDGHAGELGNGPVGAAIDARERLALLVCQRHRVAVRVEKVDGAVELLPKKDLVARVGASSVPPQAQLAHPLLPTLSVHYHIVQPQLQLEQGRLSPGPVPVVEGPQHGRC